MSRKKCSICTKRHSFSTIFKSSESDPIFLQSSHPGDYQRGQIQECIHVVKTHLNSNHPDFSRKEILIFNKTKLERKNPLQINAIEGSYDTAPL